ncbi:MAG: hypothetical protein HXX09_04835 [Bacteroidetes bacterium]|jgi:NADH:ubiquinone oxidoreductase subunit 3 (subunit A)|nr:hypothetical protein [Bacteroidota bacterium]
MKKIIPIFLVIFLFVGTFLSGCKKDEEKLANSWRINQYYENGTDKTADAQSVFNGYNLIIDKNKSYSIYYRFLGLIDNYESGTWAFSNKNKNVTFQKSNTSSTTEWTILKLMEDELWGEFQDSSKTIEVHLLPK